MNIWLLDKQSETPENIIGGIFGNNAIECGQALLIRLDVVMLRADVASSRSEARRLINQGAVRRDGFKVVSPYGNGLVYGQSGDVFVVGKKKKSFRITEEKSVEIV